LFLGTINAEKFMCSKEYAFDDVTGCVGKVSFKVDLN
jgi:hypothetical protein